MGTRSTIAIKEASGAISAIYCHWDGYPTHNGKILLENYNSEDKARALIALGGLSVLGEELGEKHDLNSRFDDADPRKKWCSFYHRDREEEWEDNKPIELANGKELSDFANGCGAKYVYTFNVSDGQWYEDNSLLSLHPDLA